jgi:hypothetical protein
MGLEEEEWEEGGNTDPCEEGLPPEPEWEEELLILSPRLE